MSAKILVATPIRSFGELVAQALQEVGYYPLLVADVANALDAARVEDFTLAVVDCEMPAPGTEFLAEALREQKRDIRLLFFHPDGDCREGITLKPGTDMRLPQPFYLPDLLTTVERMLPLKAFSASPVSTPSPAVETPPELEWFQDVKKVRRYLDYFLQSAEARAALIVHRGETIANAGELPRERADELAGLIARRWDDTRSGDLVFFVRLTATGTEYTLYAVGMGGGHVLALAFPPEIPLRRMRAQTRDVHIRLTSPLPELPRARKPIPAPAPDADAQPGDAEPDEEEDAIAITGDWSLDDDPELARQAEIFEQLLADIDLPDPDGQ